MGKVYYVQATGTGTFPIDMLRVDKCYPVMPSDVGTIANPTFNVARSVVLASHNSEWSPKAWKAVGWQLEKLKGFHPPSPEPKVDRRIRAKWEQPHLRNGRC
jgi:hypothetical protein